MNLKDIFEDMARTKKRTILVERKGRLYRVTRNTDDYKDVPGLKVYPL
jgi:hypothetical protein